MSQVATGRRLDRSARTDTTARSEAGAPVQGIRVLGPDEAKLQRRLVLAVTVFPFLGFVAAVISLWGRGITATDFGIFLATYVFTGMGVTVGFHRLFTHRSFKTSPFWRGFFAVAGSMAIEGSVIKWVADHRRHHAFADQVGDPHSPHLEEGPGITGVLKGLWHAHMGWFFSEEQTSVERWAPDLYKEPLMRRIDSLFPLWAVISFIAPAALGFVLTGSFAGAVSAFLWGSLVRIFLLHHVTWSVNSICHFYGERPFETTDFSTNNWLLSLVSFGESWHNNHHAFPTSAIHGLGRAQFDISGVFIRGLERLGIAHDVKHIPDKQLAAKRA